MKLKTLAIALMAGLLATPALADEPKTSWTGFYIGAHAGLDMTELSGGGPFGISESSIGYGLNGGFDWHMPGTPIVLGIAGDHTWTDATAIETHWSVVGRAGVVMGNAMPYVLAGYKRAEIPGLSLDGWVAGGGIEFHLARNLYLGGEYRFSSYDLPSWVPAGIDAESHEVRATLKYKFSGMF